MIQVFTTNTPASRAGPELTTQFSEWKKSFERGINIISIHTNSNQYGWMLTVLYECR